MRLQVRQRHGVGNGRLQNGRSMRDIGRSASTGLDRKVAALCATALAAIAWAGIISEAITSFELSRAVGRSPLMSVAFFYRYFTNQVVTILAWVMSITAVRMWSSRGMLGARAYGAVVVYTAVMGTTYELLLRRLWAPEGFWFVRDALMHDFIPIVTLLFWIFIAPKSALTWRDPVVWLAYPAAYCLVTLAVGWSSGSYPYAFLDPRLGGDAVLLGRVCGLAVAFLAFGWGVVGVARLAR